MNRYGYLVDLQSECETLVLGKSIRLTGLITMDNDPVESSILLLEIIKENEKIIKSLQCCGNCGWKGECVRKAKDPKICKEWYFDEQ